MATADDGPAYLFAGGISVYCLKTMLGPLAPDVTVLDALTQTPNYSGTEAI